MPFDASSSIPMGAAAFCACCCCCCMFVWVVILAAANGQIQNSIETAGQITDYLFLQPSSQRPNGCYTPEISFETNQGEAVVTTFDDAETYYCYEQESLVPWDIGDFVDIFYDPIDPEIIFMADGIYAAKAFSGWVIAISVLCVFCNCGILAYFFKAAKNEQQQPPQTAGGATTTGAAAAAAGGAAAVAVATLEDPESQKHSIPPKEQELVPFAQASEITQEQHDQQPSSVPTLSEFVQQESFDKIKVIETYAHEYPREAKTLTPAEITKTMSQITFSLDHEKAATTIAKAMGTVKCAHIVAAMQACPDSGTDVAKAMAPFCSDYQNKQMVLDQITLSFQREDIARLFPE